MDVQQIGQDLKLTGVDAFDPDLIFDCGQCFRFYKKDGIWSGIAFGKRLSVKAEGDRVILPGCTKSDFDCLWMGYLGLSEDYAAIRRQLSALGDAHLDAAMEAGKGIRILRQEPWEALCSFVISQNNNIARIRKIIETLCRTYGRGLPDGDHAFPTPVELSAASEDDLRALGLGYRAGYIRELSRSVADGSLDLQAIRKLPTPQAIETLCRVRGVGVKVASCALLFGFGKDDAFPVDVWVKRILGKYYPECRGKAPDFGRYAGLCQQYLFYYERWIEGKTGGRCTDNP
ncbi:MAG: DNA-3-methyladenine glycosylase family protein [Eubacteriales bacterium]